MGDGTTKVGRRMEGKALDCMEKFPSFNGVGDTVCTKC